MRLSNTPVRAAVATLTACTLALTVSACGSGEETKSGGLSTAATAPGAAENQAQGEGGEQKESQTAENESGKDKGGKGKSESKSTEKTTENKKRGSNGGNPTEPVEIPTLVNPFAEGELTVPTFEPISGGNEGSEEDRRQMEETVRAITNPASFAGWTRTILDNSCAAVREPAMEQFESQGLTLDMIEQMMAQQGAGIDIPQTEVSVSDVRVDGNRASATVTSNTAGGTTSQVQLFAKEDGRWKVCSAD